MCLLISFSFRDGLIVAMPPPFSAAVLRGDTSGMSGIGGAMFPLDNDGEYDLVMNIIDQDFSYIFPPIVSFFLLRHYFGNPLFRYYNFYACFRSVLGVTCS